MRNKIKLTTPSIKYSNYLVLILYCIVYVTTINVCLLPNLMNGQLIVIPYNKSFSLPLCVLCIFSVLILYRITEIVTDDYDSVATYTLRILFLLYQIPISMTLCLFSKDKLFKFWLLEMLYWIAICFALYLGKRIKIVLPTAFFVSDASVLFVRAALVGVLVIGIVLSIRSLGSFSFSVSLSDIYGYRRYYKENSNDLMTFFKSAVGMFLGPCLIVYYVYKRNVLLSAVFIIVQIALFSLARDKAYLFLLPIAVLLGIFGDRVVARFNSYMSYSYLLVSFFSLMATLNIMRTAIFELIIRRMFVIPSIFNYVYFCFFDSNEPIWWRQDTFLIDKLFSPVYAESVPILIANRMLNGRETNPNAGLFAEAYSRCGFLGIVIYPVLLLCVLRLIDICFKNAPTIVKIVLGGCLAVSLDNDVITSTSFVCTLAFLLLGSTYFYKQRSFITIPHDYATHINRREAPSDRI